MKLPKIVGVAGTNASGKDTLGELLAARGYTVVSISDTLRAELRKDGLELTRENLSGRSQQIRAAEGDGAMAQRTIAAHGGGNGLVITSVRTPGEAGAIQAAGGTMVWIDADQRVRYDRIAGAHRGRAEDMVSFEEFVRQEAVEMTPSQQGGGLNMLGVKEIADVTIDNNFASVADYEEHLRAVFELG